MFKLFSKNNYLNSLFNIKFNILFLKLRKKNKILILMKYFFFVKKIRLVFLINLDNLRFIFLFKYLNVKKVAILSNLKNSYYFDFFIKIFNMDSIKEFYITHYILEIYLKHLYKKYTFIYTKFISTSLKKKIYINSR